MVTITIRLTGVDGPWLRQKLGIVVLIKTGPAANYLKYSYVRKRKTVFKLTSKKGNRKGIEIMQFDK